ncbi:hypothetical protein AC579_9161 [Pseudocercospora musae]|uniref:Uncharacterized protein n=1 Tax=Pseudocercospora musae TaxID=113226 RepID=A0A139I753_9PEZI|nr:hypothetical protein AC579_9161 [Pseudocercospora musae]
MLPLSALLMAGAWFSPLDSFNTVAKGYAAFPLTWYAAFPLTWKDAAFSAASAAAAAAPLEKEQAALKWQGLGYCGYHGVILLPSSAKVRQGVPLGCDQQTEYTASRHDNPEPFDSREARATEESMASSVGLDLHGMDGAMLSLSPVKFAQESGPFEYLGELDWKQLSYQSLKLGIPLVCPATIPYIAGVSMIENGHNVYQHGLTWGNVFGLATAGLVVFGPGGGDLLSAAGFDKVGVRAGSFAAVYQAANYGGATPAGGIFAWAESCGMRSCAG